MFKRSFSKYARYIWISDETPYFGKRCSIIQVECVVLSSKLVNKIDEFHNLIDWRDSFPLYESFTLDLGTILRFIPGIGKSTSPFSLQWTFGNFFKLSPAGYTINGGQVTWQWNNVYHIDQEIKAQWYAWYR
ncbi:hypothetical protein A7K93_01055 [Candidatus Methylacidiphilum fumarolicum]|uniref:Uncharacterized protein n=2 Tax=Candidatus Methylacidiphilum fumarolicum TaxID=591154 RepID=I0JXU6_METFB|nr:hypothetical protein A7K73_04860 [Candidatus Methylacidiphilum fumarolicum]CCG92065.1 hypothetical protein MFUM_300019 [Methylacidiphilum fumariolicum SolV]TFE73745.1 hypothetical protein A7K72_05455 [Candidatus Methylacidiphilum fumarolicum]TFE75649.1 hypothetical protein A7K93_01055 [Candidatus Methylacidiphilum fumarolicum]TFE76812.1 hypothetical protein A7D33_08485 [Candidatus Methylacidiphilum fumarolicum]